eukprot:5979700-Alexandrium_andersonii.AAC.1
MLTGGSDGVHVCLRGPTRRGPERAGTPSNSQGGLPKHCAPGLRRTVQRHWRGFSARRTPAKGGS